MKTIRLDWLGLMAPLFNVQWQSKAKMLLITSHPPTLWDMIIEKHNRCLGSPPVTSHTVIWHIYRCHAGHSQGDYDGRGQQTASPMFIAIMSGGVGISGAELSLSCWQIICRPAFSRQLVSWRVCQQGRGWGLHTNCVSMGAGFTCKSEHGGRAHL